MLSHLENAAHAALLWGAAGLDRRDVHGPCRGAEILWSVFRTTRRTGHCDGMRKHNFRVIDGGLSPSGSSLGGLDRGRAPDTWRELRNDGSSQGLFQPQDGEERGVVPVPVVEPAHNGQVDTSIPGDGDETTPVGINGSAQVGKQQITPVSGVGSLVPSQIIVPGHRLDRVHGADLTGLPDRKPTTRRGRGHAAHSDPNNPLLQHVDPRWGSLPRYRPIASHSGKWKLVRELTEYVLMQYDSRSLESREVLDQVRVAVGVYFDKVIATYDLSDPNEIIQTACTRAVFTSVIRTLSPAATEVPRRTHLVAPVLGSLIDGDDQLSAHFAEHGGNPFRSHQREVPPLQLLQDAVAWARSCSTEYAQTTALVWACLHAGTPLDNHHIMWVRAGGLDVSHPERAFVTWETPNASATVPILPEAARYLVGIEPEGQWWVAGHTNRTYHSATDGRALYYAIRQFTCSPTLRRPTANELSRLYNHLANTRKERENHGS